MSTWLGDGAITQVHRMLLTYLMNLYLFTLFVAIQKDNNVHVLDLFVDPTTFASQTSIAC